MTVSAVLDEGGLEGRLYAGDLGEVDVASELPPCGRLEVEFLKPVSVGDDNPRPGGLANGVGKRSPEMPWKKWGTTLARKAPARKQAM